METNHIRPRRTLRDEFNIRRRAIFFLLRSCLETELVQKKVGPRRQPLKQRPDQQRSKQQLPKETFRVIGCR